MSSCFRNQFTRQQTNHSLHDENILPLPPSHPLLYSKNTPCQGVLEKILFSTILKIFWDLSDFGLFFVPPLQLRFSARFVQFYFNSNFQPPYSQKLMTSWSCLSWIPKSQVTRPNEDEPMNPWIPNIDINQRLHDLDSIPSVNKKAMRDSWLCEIAEDWGVQEFYRRIVFFSITPWGIKFWGMIAPS